MNLFLSPYREELCIYSVFSIKSMVVISWKSFKRLIVISDIKKLANG